MSGFKRTALLLLTGTLLVSCAKPLDPPPELFSELNGLLRSDRDAQVIQKSRKALEQFPDSARLKLILSKALFSKGDFEETVELLEVLIEEGWKDWKNYRRLGISHFYLGDFEQAQEYLEQVIEADPRDAAVLKLLAYLYYYLGEGNKALASFERLEELKFLDLESSIAWDGMLGLTGQWREKQMLWHVDSESGIQVCYPGGWVLESKAELGLAGKINITTFSDPDRRGLGEGAFPYFRTMLLLVYHNASRHPLPRVFKGAFRPGERTSQGGRWMYPTRPGAQPSYQGLPREPKEMARYLSRASMEAVFDGWDFKMKSSWVSSWSASRSGAVTSLGSALGERPNGRLFTVENMGIYDSVNDTFGFIALYGHYGDQGEVLQIAQAIFNLAVFGETLGIPPAPEQFLPQEVYQARIEGFLQARKFSPAATEAQQAIKTYPQAGRFHWLLGKSQRALWRMDEAKTAYEKAQELGFSTSAFKQDLGELHLEFGEPSLAETAFLWAMREKPLDPGLVMRCGLAAYRQDKLDLARNYFTTARIQAPHSQLAQYFSQAMESVHLPEQQGTPLQWHRLPEGGGFCYPGNWTWARVEGRDGELDQILFAQEAASPQKRDDFKVVLLYLRYDFASNRVGRVEGHATPRQVLEGFLEQAYERITDPQKQPLAEVGLIDAPIFYRGLDHYVTGGYVYTSGSSRQVVRALAYYQPDLDRLHILSFRAAGMALGEWEDFLQVCFETAKFRKGLNQ